MKKSGTSKEQAECLRSFRDTTEASEKQAITYMNKAKWNLQQAVNLFFDEGAVPESESLGSTGKIEQLFLELSAPCSKSPDLRYMDEDRFEEFNRKYFKYDSENVVLGYILINIMGVETSGYIEFRHFLRLFQHLKVSDPNDLYKHVARLQVDLNNDAQAYKQLYSKIYRFYLVGNKDLSLDYSLAEQLWLMYLKPIMPLYRQFAEYLERRKSKPARVHRDLWNMVYEFGTTVTDLSKVSELDGWPVFLDDFVEESRNPQ